MMWQVFLLVLLTPLVLGEVGRFSFATPNGFTHGYQFHHETKDPSAVLREFFSSHPFPVPYDKFTPPPEIQKFFSEDDYYFGFPKSSPYSSLHRNGRFRRTQRTANDDFRSEGRSYGSDYRRSYERHYGDGGRFGDILDHSGHSGDGSSYTEVSPPWGRHRQGRGHRQPPYFHHNFGDDRGPDSLVGDGLSKGYGVETVSRGPNSFSRDRKAGYERSYKLNANKERNYPNGYFRSWSNAHGKTYNNNWSSDSNFHWNSGSPQNESQFRSRGPSNNFRRWNDNRSSPNRGSSNFRSNSWSEGRPEWVDEIRKNVLDVFRGQ